MNTFSVQFKNWHKQSFMSRMRASGLSQVPNAKKQMKARGHVSRCLEAVMKHEAQVFDMTFQMKQ